MTTTIVLLILTATILLRGAAAVIALRLARHLRHRWHCYLLFGALIGATLRPLYTLSRALTTPHGFAPDLLEEVLGLGVSFLLLGGIYGLQPVLEEIRNQSERYRRIVDATREGILIVTATGLVSFVNRQMAKMLGYSEEALLRRPYLDLVAPGSRERAAALLRATPDNPGSVSDLCLQTATGGELCTLVSCSPIAAESNNPLGTLLMAMDISDRHRIEEALRSSENFARATVDALAQRVAILSADGGILAANRCWQEHAHCPIPDQPEKGDNYLELLDHAAAEEHAAADAFARGIRGVLVGQLSEFTLEYSRTDEEEVRWYLGRITPFSNDGGTFAVVTHDDITALKTAEAAVKELAYQDTLTGLPNRLLLQDRLDQQLIQAGREQDQVAVLFLDLDHFKVVNDTLGHGAGDHLLQVVAKRLLGCVRKSDTVARIGGDEFVIILNGLDNSGDATVTARKILHTLTLPVRLEGQEVFTSTSIGIALFPDDADKAETLISHADMAMYLAKEQGRNTYRYFSRNLNERAQQRLRTEIDLRHALERREIQLYFQDQVAVAENRICGVEALIRWNHPERGMLLPGEFLPLAEETGLILPLGNWILRRACEKAREWDRQGCPPVRIAINLSRRQLADPELLPTLRETLAETGLPPERIELEVTENILQQDPTMAAAVLPRLSELGVTIAVDDFGTGFTSLNLLRRLPVKRLKIDHTFIHEIFTDQAAAAIVRTTIGIAHNLGLTVIAEGVENEQQRGFLLAQGCDELQGVHLTRPAPEIEFLRLLRGQPAVDPETRG